MERMTPQQQREAHEQYERERSEAIPNFDWKGWALAITTMNATPVGMLVAGICGRVAEVHDDGTLTIDNPFEYVSVPIGAGQRSSMGQPLMLSGATTIIVRPIAMMPLEEETAARREPIACARFEAEVTAREVVKVDGNKPKEERRILGV